MSVYPLDFLAKTLQGVGFQVQRRITLSNNETKYIVLDLSQTTDKCVFGMPIEAGAVNGHAHLDTYSCDNYILDESWEVLKLNPNRANSNQAPMVVASSVNGQYNLREYTIGSESTNQNAGGGFTTNDAIKILDASKPLVFEFSNQENDTIELSFGYVWFECAKEQ